MVFIVHFSGFFYNLLLTSTAFLITLFGFLSSLDFNNRIENLTLMTKNFGGPLFSGGGGPEAVPLLPPSRAGPVCIYVSYLRVILLRILRVQD